MAEDRPVATRAASRRATYRLQLTPTFGFEQACELVEPLARLGVSHLYLSPIAQAVPASEHGYDVVDHTRVRAEFGGADGLRTLLDRAARAGLGVIVDHVPNHVSVARPELNPPWWAMLRDGPDAPDARWFDVDWEGGGGRVIVPRLGAPLADVVAAGALAVRSDAEGSYLSLGKLRLPLRAGTEELELHELLAEQHYRLTWWREPARNTRRFFTIDDLVAVRVEADEVRRSVDSLLAPLIGHPAFAGVRIDHVDGLADPGGYLRHLRGLLGPDRWILVEKILGPDESLPADWPVDGTTGYEFLSVAEHALADPSGESVWVGFAERRSAAIGSYHDAEIAARREVLDGGLRPDLDRVVRTALGALRTRTSAEAVDVDDLRRAVVEVTLGLDRYRTYLPDDPQSERVLADVVLASASAHPGLATEIGRFADLVEQSVSVRERWQQLTGPAMAKGAEDRAFYRHVVLAGWNEVGGRPDRWAAAPEEFHRHQQQVVARSPWTLLASTTHDTKRSSGVRSRSLALTAMSERFVDSSERWIDGHAGLVDKVAGVDVSLALQTAVTAWPIDEARLQRFLVKCAREADVHTSWIQPDDAYESALAELAISLCATLGSPDTELAAIADEVDLAARTVDQAWTVLHLTAPGVPDLYQGMPMALHTLVDPDNRDAPDWSRWRQVVELAERAIEDGAVADAGDLRGDVARARTVMSLLRFRSRHPDSFGDGAAYRPLACTGEAADRTVAFLREPDGDGERVAVVAVGPGVHSNELDDTVVRLPTGSWYGVIDPSLAVIGGADVSLGALLGEGRAIVLHRS